MVDLTTGEFWLASGSRETGYAPLPWSLWDGRPAKR